MNTATPAAKQPVFVDLCTCCGADVLHWYEQVGINQALATMASDPLVQGEAADRYVVCPQCGAENTVVSLPAVGDYGPREAIVARRIVP